MSRLYLLYYYFSSISRNFVWFDFNCLIFLVLAKIASYQIDIIAQSTEDVRLQAPSKEYR